MYTYMYTYSLWLCLPVWMSLQHLTLLYAIAQNHILFLLPLLSANTGCTGTGVEELGGEVTVICVHLLGA